MGILILIIIIVIIVYAYQIDKSKKEMEEKKKVNDLIKRNEQIKEESYKKRKSLNINGDVYEIFSVDIKENELMFIPSLTDDTSFSFSVKKNKNLKQEYRYIYGGQRTENMYEYSYDITVIMDDRFNIGKLSSDDSKHIVDKYGLTEENTDNYLIIKFVKISTDYIDIKSPYKIIVFDNKNNDKLKKTKFEEYVKNNIKYSLSFWHSFKTKDSYETKYENILYPLKNDNIGLILLNDALALTFPLGYKQPVSRHFISYEDIKKVNILYYNENIEGNYEWGGSFTEALTLEIIFRNDEENDKTIEKTIYYYHYNRGEYESGEYGSVRRNQFNFDNCEYGGSADLFYKSFKTLIDKLLIDYGLELELKKDEKIRL